MEFKEIKYIPSTKIIEINEETVYKIKTQDGLVKLNKALFCSSPDEDSLDEYIQSVVDVDKLFFDLRREYNVIENNIFIDFTKNTLNIGE